jgi:CheY-like chemotaxis protein
MQRALIIDDQPPVGKAISIALESEGFETVVANSGSAGLTKFNDGRFDVAIVDIYMPGMDGVKIIRALRERDPKLPIIAMSGLRLNETKRTALDLLPSAAGFSDVIGLQKPIRIAALKEAIQKAKSAVA